MKYVIISLAACLLYSCGNPADSDASYGMIRHQSGRHLYDLNQSRISNNQTLRQKEYLQSYQENLPDSDDEEY